MFIAKATVLGTLGPENETSANESLAVEFMGWKWMSYIGTPTRSHPEYPAKCRVRNLMSPTQLEMKQWIEWLAVPEHEARPADGRSGSTTVIVLWVAARGQSTNGKKSHS